MEEHRSARANEVWIHYQEWAFAFVPASPELGHLNTMDQKMPEIVLHRQEDL